MEILSGTSKGVFIELEDEAGLTDRRWATQLSKRAQRRLEALDRASGCNHPTGDIDEMLADIARGRNLRSADAESVEEAEAVSPRFARFELHLNAFIDCNPCIHPNVEPGRAMKTMTIRNVPTELSAALEAEKRRRGLSLNRTVLLLMQEALGVSTGRSRSNGLRRLAGSWSEDEFRNFEQAVAPFAEIEKDR